MSDNSPEDTLNTQPAQPVMPQQDNEELSEQELDNVNGGGAQPHMQPPGPPVTPIIIHGVGH